MDDHRHYNDNIRSNCDRLEPADYWMCFNVNRNRNRFCTFRMRISRAGKHTKAFWRISNSQQEKWLNELPITPSEIEYGQYKRTMDRMQGFAAGWIAAIAWERRRAKIKK